MVQTIVNGSAVYKARMLNGLYMPPRSYDDLAICNSMGYYKGGSSLFDEENRFLAAQQVGQREEIKVYPNPTTGLIHVEYKLQAGESGVIELTDVLGKSVKRVALSSLVNKVTIDLGNVAAGVYYYSYVVNGVRDSNGKVVVVK